MVGASSKYMYFDVKIEGILPWVRFTYSLFKIISYLLINSLLYFIYFFFQVNNWVKELKKILGSDICLFIAGNKVDLEKERNVTIEEAEEWVFFLIYTLK